MSLQGLRINVQVNISTTIIHEVQETKRKSVRIGKKQHAMTYVNSKKIVKAGA